MCKEHIRNIQGMYGEYIYIYIYMEYKQRYLKYKLKYLLLNKLNKLKSNKLNSNKLKSNKLKNVDINYKEKYNKYKLKYLFKKNRYTITGGTQEIESSINKLEGEFKSLLEQIKHVDSDIIKNAIINPEAPSPNKYNDIFDHFMTKFREYMIIKVDVSKSTNDNIKTKLDLINNELIEPIIFLGGESDIRTKNIVWMVSQQIHLKSLTGELDKTLQNVNTYLLTQSSELEKITSYMNLTQSRKKAYNKYMVFFEPTIIKKNKVDLRYFGNQYVNIIIELFTLIDEINHSIKCKIRCPLLNTPPDVLTGPPDVLTGPPDVLTGPPNDTVNNSFWMELLNGISGTYSLVIFIILGVIIKLTLILYKP